MIPDRNTRLQQTFWMFFFLDPAAVISTTTGVASLATGNINEPWYLNVFLHLETCAVFEEGCESEVKANFWWRRNPRRNPGNKSWNCFTNLACPDCGPMVVRWSLLVKMNVKRFVTTFFVGWTSRLYRYCVLRTDWFEWPELGGLHALTQFDPLFHWLPVLKFWTYLERCPSKCFSFDRFDFLIILLGEIWPLSWEDKRTICEESDEINIYLGDFEFSHIRDVYVLGPSKYSCIISANSALPIAQEVTCGRRSQVESSQSLYRYFLSEADYRSGWSCLFACDTKDLAGLRKRRKISVRGSSFSYEGTIEFVCIRSWLRFCWLAHEWLDDCSRKSTSTISRAKSAWISHLYSIR